MSGRYTVASCPGPGCSAGRDWAAKLLEMRAFSQEGVRATGRWTRRAGAAVYVYELVLARRGDASNLGSLSLASGAPTGCFPMPGGCGWRGRDCSSIVRPKRWERPDTAHVHQPVDGRGGSGDRRPWAAMDGCVMIMVFPEQPRVQSITPRTVQKGMHAMGRCISGHW